MKRTIAALAALLLAGGAASAACYGGATAQKPAPQSTAELPVLPPEAAGS